MVRIGPIVSGVFSRWTMLALIAAALAWNIHNRIDQLGAPKLLTTTISAAATLTKQ
jgi:hypothetical protein